MEESDLEKLSHLCPSRVSSPSWIKPSSALSELSTGLAFGGEAQVSSHHNSKGDEGSRLFWLKPLSHGQCDVNNMVVTTSSDFFGGFVC